MPALCSNRSHSPKHRTISVGVRAMSPSANTSLADAVAEFNRYNTHRIVIEDPAVAAIRISGTFRTLNYEAFVRVLDHGFAIHSRTSEDTTTKQK